MMNMRSMIAPLGSGFLAAALVILTNGCSCFSSCETTAPAITVPPAEKTQVKKTTEPVQTPQKKTAETVKIPAKKIDKTPDVKQTVKQTTPVVKTVTLAPTVSTVWTLELDSLKGAEKSWEEPAKNITLIYDPEKKQIAGCAGINRYFGPTAVDEKMGTFKTGALGVTKMAGPGMKYEDLFLKVLSKVDSYLIKDGKLLLKSGKDTVAVFTTEVKETK